MSPPHRVALNEVWRTCSRIPFLPWVQLIFFFGHTSDRRSYRRRRTAGGEAGGGLHRHIHHPLLAAHHDCVGLGCQSLCHRAARRGWDAFEKSGRRAGRCGTQQTERQEPCVRGWRGARLGADHAWKPLKAESREKHRARTRETTRAVDARESPSDGTRPLHLRSTT